MRFLLDVCVDVRVAEWLRGQGRDATHLRDEGLQRLRNGAIFEKVVKEGRILLTHDLDFGEIMATSKGFRPAIILFRLRDTRYVRIVERFSSILMQSAEVLGGGEVVIIVEETRHRIRRFPDASNPPA